MPKKERSPSIEELKKERNKLMLTKENPVRLKEIIDKIDFIEYGIKNNL